MKRLTPRLWFVDFPHKEGVEALEAANPLYRALRSRFDLQLDPVDPEFLLCSIHGHRHIRYDCTKVLYVDENIYPDFSTYDWAFSFDPTKGRNFRLPAWAIRLGNPSALLRSVQDPAELLKSKERFCTLDYSNRSGVEQKQFLNILSSRKRVDANRGFGNNKRRLNNNDTADAFEITSWYNSCYKFAIAFENANSPGYTTERILIPLFRACVPIYWGNPEIAEEFNPEAFINAHDFSSLDDLADHVIRVDADDDWYLQYLSATPFTGNRLPEDACWGILADRFDHIFSQKIDRVSRWHCTPRCTRRLILSITSSLIHTHKKRQLKRCSTRKLNPTIDIGQSDIPDRIRASRISLQLTEKKSSPKIWFTDFLDEEMGLHLQSALSRRFDLHLDNVNPEFLICGYHGRAHLRYRCAKILFTQENHYPDFRVYDWAFSFDPTGGRNYRLPVWALWMGDPSVLLNPVNNKINTEVKKRFCAFVYSNPRCEERNKFYQILSSKKQVDAAGRLFNNMDGLSDRFHHQVFTDLPGFYSNYKFTIAFENASSPGYTTEKIIMPLLGGSIPIYWGNPDIGEEFNPDAFINAHSFGTFAELADYVLEVDSNDDLYMSYLSAPKFINNKLPQDADWEILADRVEHIFSTKIIPASTRGLARHMPQVHSLALRKMNKLMNNKLRRPPYRKLNPTLNEKNIF